MRSFGRILVCLAVGLAPALALAAGGASQVRVSGDCIHEQYKPRVIVIACGDGNAFVQKLKWSHWDTTQAAGRGTYEVNSCTPSCVAGHFHRYAVAVTLSRPRACPHQAHKVFKRITLGYASPQAAKGNPKRLSLFCPAR